MSELVSGGDIRIEYDADMDAIIMFGSLCMALATMGFVIYVIITPQHLSWCQPGAPDERASPLYV